MASQFYVNPLGGFNAGQAVADIGQAVVNRQQQEQEQQAIEQQRALIGRVMQGDDEAIPKLYQVNPQLGAALEERAIAKANAQNQEQAQAVMNANKQFIQRYWSTPREERQQLLQSVANDPQMSLVTVDDGLLEMSPQAQEQEAKMATYGLMGEDFYKRFVSGEADTDRKFAPQSNAPKVDPKSGQIYYTVFDPNTGEAKRVDVPGAVAQTPEEKRTGEVGAETSKEIRKQSVKIAADSFNQLKQARKSVGNIDKAIKALDKGAKTGAIQQYLPSITAASIELDNVASQMGLDVIGGTTFGALSESELNFALDSAIPRGLPPEELKDFLQRKREAQSKLADELRQAAIFMGKGNTFAEYLEKETQQDQQESQQQSSGPPANATPDELIEYYAAQGE